MYIFFVIFQCVIFLKGPPPPKKKMSTKISQLIGTGLCVPKGSILGSANEDHVLIFSSWMSFSWTIIVIAVSCNMIANNWFKMYYFSIFVTDYLCVKIISPLIHCRLLPFKIRDNNDEIHKAIFMHKNRGIILVLSFTINSLCKINEQM